MTLVLVRLHHQARGLLKAFETGNHSAKACMSSISSRKGRPSSPSRTSSWRPRSRPTPTASVTAIFGAPVNSVSSVSAISTLPSSPLRHEITTEVASPSLESGMSSVGHKREREHDTDVRVVASVDSSCEAAAAAAESSQDFPQLPTPEITKRPRLEEADAIGGAGPSPKQSTSSLREVATPAAAVAQPIPSSRNSWLESLYRPGGRSAPYASSVPSDHPQSVGAPTPTPTPPTSLQQTEPELTKPESTVEKAEAPSNISSTPVPEFQKEIPPPTRKGSIHSGIAAWFGASPRTSYVSDEPSHPIPEPSPVSSKNTPAPLRTSPPSDPAIASTPSLLVAVSTESTSSTLGPTKVLHPSTSRYSLRLPLLGASKQRLDEISPPQIHVHHEGDVNTPPAVSPLNTTEQPAADNAAPSGSPSTEPILNGDALFVCAPAHTNLIQKFPVQKWHLLCFLSLALRLIFHHHGGAILVLHPVLHFLPHQRSLHQ